MLYPLDHDAPLDAITLSFLYEDKILLIPWEFEYWTNPVFEWSTARGVALNDYGKLALALLCML